MSDINIKQFGIWMDTHHATVVGKVSENNFVVIEHITNPSAESNSSEKQAHHAERTLQQKFFKEIAAHMENATEVHITGTGTSPRAVHALPR